MEEEQGDQQRQQVPVEAKTLTEDIKEFNDKLDQSVADLTKWKINLLNIQEKFMEKLRNRTLGMKIK